MSLLNKLTSRRPRTAASAQIRERLEASRVSLEQIGPRKSEAQDAWRLAIIEGTDAEKADRRRALKAIEYEEEELLIVREELAAQLVVAEEAEAESARETEWQSIVRDFCGAQASTAKLLTEYSKHADALVAAVLALKKLAAEDRRLEQRADALGRRNDLYSLGGGRPGHPPGRMPLHEDRALQLLPCLHADGPDSYDLFHEEREEEARRRAARDKALEESRDLARRAATEARALTEQQERASDPERWRQKQMSISMESERALEIDRQNRSAGGGVTITVTPEPGV